MHKHSSWKELVQTSLHSQQPIGLQFIGTVVAIDPLTIQDSESVKFHVDRSSIQSVMQDFSFLFIGQIVQFGGQLTKKMNQNHMMVEATYRVSSVRHGNDFKKVVSGIYAQFDLTWVLNSQLRSENEAIANLKRKKRLSETLIDQQQWPVTELVSRQDMKKIYLGIQLVRLQQKTTQYECLTMQEIRILEKVQEMTTRQQITHFIEHSNLYNHLQNKLPHSLHDLRTIRRFMLPNSQWQQLEMSPNLLRLHMRYPGHTQKKQYDRATIKTLMNIYQ